MKKFIFLLVVSSMLLVVGCGNEEVKNESSYNQNEIIANRSVEKPYQPQQGEVFVGHSDYNGRDCYLLENSIRQNNDKSVDCKIKMVTSATDVEYLEYKFYGKGTMDFTTNAGFSSTVDKYSTPIEYNVYETLTQYVDMSEVDNTLHITPEEFQRKYNNNLQQFIMGKIDETTGKRLYEHLKINRIAPVYFNSKKMGLIFKTNEPSISIETYSKDNEQYLSGVQLCMSLSENSNSAWQNFCKTAVIAAHSINNKKNLQETEQIIRNLLEQFDNGNLSPTLTVDGIEYYLGGGLSLGIKDLKIVSFSFNKNN